MQTVVVIGGGVAGLATALALHEHAADVTIIERDPAPPPIAPEHAFEQWARPGVPQFRHAHMFLARLRTLLRDQHPRLLAELLAAGLELSAVDEVLPPAHAERYVELPGDDDLRHLWGRRATFEYVLRRHVGALANVRFIHNAAVERLIPDQRGDSEAVRITGVELVRDGTRELVNAELVVDASGKRTRSPSWLEALGVGVESRSIASGYSYVCRHYRLRQPEIARSRRGSGANLDYFGYVTFYAEHGHFAVTLSCPDEEAEVARAMRRPEGFEAICAHVPVLQQWIAASVPTSKVLGAAQFENRTRRFGTRAGRPLLGFVAVGDSLVETNPMYGRGCTMAFLQAHALAAAVGNTRDPAERARVYYARARALLQPHFDFCVQTDRMFRTRARVSRGEPIALVDRVLKYAYEHAFMPALQRSPLVAREMVKAMEMREISSARLRFAMMLQIALGWLLGLLRANHTPGLDPGPPRSVLLARVDPARDSLRPADRSGEAVVQAR